MNFSIVLASRQRPTLLSNLIQSIQSTTFNLDLVEVLVGIDDDDVEYQIISKNLQAKYPFVKFFTRPRSPWLNRDYLNWLSKEHSIGKYLIICNDDTEFKTRHWDTVLLNRLAVYLQDKPDGIVYGHLNDALGKSYCCFPLISRKAHDALGYSMPPEYPSWNADIFLWDVYNGIGRVCHIPEVLVDHISYHTGKRGTDVINHHVRDLNNRGGYPIPSVEVSRSRLRQCIQLGSVFEIKNISIVSPKLSIILSGCNPDKWEKLVYTNGSSEDWEFVIVSSEPMPSRFLGCHRVTYVVDNGSPTKRLCVGAACAKGKYFTWATEDAVFVPEKLDKMVKLLDQKPDNKRIIVAKVIDQNGNVPSDQSIILNKKYVKSSLISDSWVDFNPCMMFSSYYRNLGGFDTSFNLCETSYSDFAIRAQRNGAKVELIQDPLLDYSSMKSDEDKTLVDIKKSHEMPLYEKFSNLSDRMVIDLDNWEKDKSDWLKTKNTMF